MNQPPEIIDYLRDQARTLLASPTLETLEIGAAGLFPYVWQIPDSSSFNARTYGWISAALEAGALPARQAGPFTTEYIKALSSVTYGLSSADQAAIDRLEKRVRAQQDNLVSVWRQAGFPVPPGSPPIDGVIETIATTWASPATNLFDMQNAVNLAALLNRTPMSGQVILPQLMELLQTMGTATSMASQTTMNLSYLNLALTGTRSPSADDGGLTVTAEGHDSLVPAWKVADSQAAIDAALASVSTRITLDMEVARSNATGYAVQISGGAGFGVGLGFFGCDVGGVSSYFSDEIATSQNRVILSMDFTGVSLINYQPVTFSLAERKSWYWLQPIVDAIKNGDSDVTGFKFALDPGIDFKTGGNFGFTTGVAIANYPTVSITVKGADYSKIQKTFEMHTESRVSFLDIPLASASASTYSNSVVVNASEQTVTITLRPPPISDRPQLDRTAWVLGAVLDYPAA